MRVPGWALALAVLASYAGLAGARLRSAGWDATSFIVAGDAFTDRDRLDAPIRVLPNSRGYDGQFYYRLGLDPFTAEASGHGITLDNPAVRGARILYPLLGWASSLGRHAILPWAMVGINLLGTAALAWIGAGIARRYGAPDWAGLVPALYPGFIVTVVRDTTEITAAVPMLLAVAFALRGRAWSAGLCAAVAVLARETTLFALAGFGLAELFRSVKARRLCPALAAYAVPACVFVVWQAAILVHWRQAPLNGASQDLGPPLLGLARFFATAIARIVEMPRRTPAWNGAVFSLFAACMLLMTTVPAAAVAVSRAAPAGVVLSWVFCAGLALCFTTAIWAGPQDFLRAGTELFLLGAVLTIVSADRGANLVLLVPTALTWAACAWVL
ncbi:MAG: hypothetical protein JOZ05_00440 [Acetobacteraceae bacterium]|nr:hypothetical protein [Acetobacteraceae bacterium]